MNYSLATDPGIENQFPTFCTILARKVENYFQDKENRKKFEDWYRQKYGKEYVWKI